MRAVKSSEVVDRLEDYELSLTGISRNMTLQCPHLEPVNYKTLHSGPTESNLAKNVVNSLVFHQESFDGSQTLKI